MKKVIERGLKLAESVLNARRAVVEARENLGAAQAALTEAETAFGGVLLEEGEPGADDASVILHVLRDAAGQVGGIDTELIARRSFGEPDDAAIVRTTRGLRLLVRRKQAVNKGGGFYAAVEV